MKFAALVSGGKDSLFAAFYMVNQGWEPVLLVRILPATVDSYMFHTVNLHVVEKQAECAGLPLASLSVSGVKEVEVQEFSHGLLRLSRAYGFKALVTGGVWSEYQRVRFDAACEAAGIKCFSPLWHKKPDTLFKAYLEHGFKFMFSGVYALGFNEAWVGRVIRPEDLLELQRLNQKYGISVIGEGGEYESLVLDCPLFESKRLSVCGRRRRSGAYSYEFVVEQVKTTPKRSESPYVCITDQPNSDTHDKY
ncbi:MAG: diphthine--ammonia ligase [Thermoprotei archaeon]